MQIDANDADRDAILANIDKQTEKLCSMAVQLSEGAKEFAKQVIANVGDDMKQYGCHAMKAKARLDIFKALYAGHCCDEDHQKVVYAECCDDPVECVKKARELADLLLEGC